MCYIYRGEGDKGMECKCLREIGERLNSRQRQVIKQFYRSLPRKSRAKFKQFAMYRMIMDGRITMAANDLLNFIYHNGTIDNELVKLRVKQREVMLGRG